MLDALLDLDGGVSRRRWRLGTPVPLACAPDTPTADIRIGYAR
ncbi:hypothetical protein ACFCY8_18700 [Streptomyces noursei]